MARITYPALPHVPRKPAIERLLWRAGFGPSPAERARYQHASLTKVIEKLLAPRHPAWKGAPMRWIDGDGHAHPIDIHATGDGTWSVEVLWWLDRMVRTSTPLVERMTLNLHDHFATSMSKVGNREWMIAQNELLRRYALGNMKKLTKAMVTDHAMQDWLDLAGSTKDSPNENFARELMELFTIGLVYTQRDVSEAARALTGYTFDWDTKTFGFDPEQHDSGMKTIFGKRGNWGPLDVVDLCFAHPAHAKFFTRKIWDFFIPTPPSAKRQRQLNAAYVRSGFELRPLLRTIFRSREFYAHLDQPDMIKPPVVHYVGAMRAMRIRSLDNSARWVLDDMGQQPFFPPNVAGWHQGEEFLSTGYLKARWDAMSTLTERFLPKPGAVPRTELPATSLRVVTRQCGTPWMSSATRAHMKSIAASIQPEGAWDDHAPIERRMVLAQLMLAGPDAMVH